MVKVTPLAPENRGDFARQQVRAQDDSNAAAPQSVGQCFRAIRVGRGEDLSAASRALRIRKDQLGAIEEGRLDDLPGRTYAVGFVRSYAGYLGLDPAEYVDRFKAEIGSRGEPSSLKGLPENAGDSRLPYGWMFMGLVVLGVVGFGGYHLVRSAEFRSIPQPIAPVPVLMAPEPGRHVAIPKRSVHAQQPANIAAHATAVPAAAAGLLPSAGGASNSASPTSAPAGSTLAALPSGQAYGTQNKNARVVLHARAVTHVLVEGPGGRVYINRILHPGDAYRVPDLVGLSLTTPDGGAVSLELDGQDVGVAGHTGQMTEALSLDPQAIVDRTRAGNLGER